MQAVLHHQVPGERRQFPALMSVESDEMNSVGFFQVRELRRY